MLWKYLVIKKIIMQSERFCKQTKKHLPLHMSHWLNVGRERGILEWGCVGSQTHVQTFSSLQGVFRKLKGVQSLFYSSSLKFWSELDEVVESIPRTCSGCSSVCYCRFPCFWLLISCTRSKLETVQSLWVTMKSGGVWQTDQRRMGGIVQEACVRLVEKNSKALQTVVLQKKIHNCSLA